MKPERASRRYSATSIRRLPTQSVTDVPWRFGMKQLTSTNKHQQPVFGIKIELRCPAPTKWALGTMVTVMSSKALRRARVSATAERVHHKQNWLSLALTAIRTACLGDADLLRHAFYFAIKYLQTASNLDTAGY